MNYRERMQNTSLSEEQKARISAAVTERAAARRAEKARTVRRTTAAVSISLALALAIAVPAGICFGTADSPVTDPSASLPGETEPAPDNPPSTGGGGGGNQDDRPTLPQDPTSVSGKLTYEPRYAAGGRIVITCRVLAGDAFTVETRERGFAVSYRLLSSAPYAQVGSVTITEFVYEIELTPEGAGEFLAGGLILHAAKGYEEACILYGHRPAEGAYADGTIYMSAVSEDGALSAYLYFLLEQGEITEDEYHERLSEYWRNSGGVHEDLTVK